MLSPNCRFTVCESAVGAFFISNFFRIQCNKAKFRLYLNIWKDVWSRISQQLRQLEQNGLHHQMRLVEIYLIVQVSQHFVFCRRTFTLSNHKGKQLQGSVFTGLQFLKETMFISFHRLSRQIANLRLRIDNNTNCLRPLAFEKRILVVYIFQFLAYLNIWKDVWSRISQQLQQLEQKGLHHQMRHVEILKIANLLCVLSY